ncbi:MAG: DUF4383 domain-containing protein [Salinimicrobium sp.]
MRRLLTGIDYYAVAIGILLLIQGLWNLIDPPFLGIFTSNVLHAVIHVVLGIIGIWTGWRTGAYGFCLFLGILLLGVGILYFIQGIGPILEDLFNLNSAVAWLNIVIGAISLLFALGGRKQEVHA